MSSLVILSPSSWLKYIKSPKNYQPGHSFQKSQDIFGPILRTGNFWSRQRFADFLSRRTSAAVPAVAASERAGSVAHAAAAAGQLEVLQLLGERCELDELVDEEGGFTCDK